MEPDTTLYRPVLTPKQVDEMLAALATRLRAAAAEIIQAPEAAALARLPVFMEKLAQVQDLVETLRAAAREGEAARPSAAKRRRRTHSSP
jgi:hypothetical protein